MKKNKRGFTVAEAVIAMTIVAIVTAVAVSAFAYAAKAKRSMLRDADTTMVAENLLECFRAASTEEEFQTNVTFAEGVTLSSGEADAEGYRVYTYVSPKYDYTASVRVRYSDIERSSFSIVMNENEGDELLSFAYEKEGSR